MGFFRAVVARVQQEVSIDPLRIYASGHSNGAYLAQRLACDAEDLFASATEYAGGSVTGLGSGCALSRGVAIGMYHGGSDNVVPISSGRTSRDEWAPRQSCTTRSPATGEPDHVTYTGCRDGVKVDWTVLPGQGHVWPTGATATAMRDSMWALFDQYPLP